MAQSITVAADRARSRPVAAVTLVAVAVGAVLAALSGLAAAGVSVDKKAVVLPLVAGTGLLLGVLALTRFQLYVFFLLASRSVLDLTKLTERAAGDTGTTGVARALDPTALLGAMFLGLAAVWLLAQFHHRGRLLSSPVRRALVLFGMSVLASAIPAAHRASALAEGARILAVVVMFVVIEELCLDLVTVRRVVAACFASLVLPVLVTLGGFAIGSPRAEAKGAFTRILGTYQQSNDFGRYLMVFIIMGVALHPFVSSRQRALFRFLLPTLGIFLVLTYTRTALIATMLGLLVVGILQSKRVLVGLAVTCVVFLAFVPSLAGRFTELATTSTSEGETNSLAWRLDYWLDVLPLANSSPIIGIGINETQFNTDKAKQPHNDFVRAYVETGIVGLVAYVALIAAMLALGRKAVRVTERGTFERGLAVGFLGVALSFLAVSLAANVISNVATLWYVFAFAACASAVTRLRQEAAAAPPETAPHGEADPTGTEPVPVSG